MVEIIIAVLAFIVVIALVAKFIGSLVESMSKSDAPETIIFETKSDMAKARARKKTGEFVGDNPETPQNEAWKSGKPGRKKSS